MASKIEQQDIRGLDIDKVVKGFGKFMYVFKSDCTISTSNGDSTRWYSRTATDLTPTSPMRNANVAALAKPLTMEQEWTRNTFYSRKYMAECFISDEDIRTADIDVFAGQLQALTRAITKQVDSRIFDVVTKDLSPANAAATDINVITTSGAWSSSAGDPISDLLNAQRVIWTSGGYDARGATVWLSPLDYQRLLVWVINAKGSSIPNFSSEKVESGVITTFLGFNLKVSENVTADYAVMIIPKLACTWKTAVGLTSAVDDESGLGKRIRVWEDGEAVLTDPKAVCLISNTQ